MTAGVCRDHSGRRCIQASAASDRTRLAGTVWSIAGFHVHDVSVGNISMGVVILGDVSMNRLNVGVVDGMSDRDACWDAVSIDGVIIGDVRWVVSGPICVTGAGGLVRLLRLAWRSKNRGGDARGDVRCCGNFCFVSWCEHVIICTNGRGSRR